MTTPIRTDTPLEPIVYSPDTERTSDLFFCLTPRTPLYGQRKRRFTDTHKWCPDCEQDLAHEWFYADPATASGLRTYCRHCEAERVRQYRKRIAERKSA